MKILSQCVLAAALSSVAQACATPVEIADDIQEVNPESLGDSGVPGGGSGGSAGNGGVGQGGSGQSGAGGLGSSGSSGAGGQAAGAGGTLGGGGTAGASGAGGSSAGGAGGAGGAAGTGGTSSGSVFDPEACDFENIAGCEELACATACTTNDGGYCADNCPSIVTCVSTDPMCVITEQDPLCAVRVGQTQTENACTVEVQSLGGANPTDPNQPSFVARRFVECLCSVPRG